MASRTHICDPWALHGRIFGFFDVPRRHQKKHRFLEPSKNNQNGRINRTLGAQGTICSSKNIRRTPPGAGRFKLKAESEPKSPVPEGLVPSLPPRRLQNLPFGDEGSIFLLLPEDLYTSKFHIIFSDHPFSVFFRAENIHNGSRRPLGRPKSLLYDFSIDFGSILKPSFHEKCIKKSMHFS